MSSLKDINFNVSYRSDMGNLVDLFYIPCLERATIYQRAVGYFTSNGLAMAAKGLSAFIRGSGKMFLVASPDLNEEDRIAIAQGYEARHDVLARAMIRCFDAEVDTLVRDRLSCLAWLIANERLEIKIAVRCNLDRTFFSPGIYHEKMGVFEDTDGLKVAFSGSSNETSGGLVSNFEAIDVFWSWDDQHGRAVLKQKNFSDLWNDRTPTLEVMSFPRAVFERIFEKFKTSSAPQEDPESDSSKLSKGNIVRPRKDFGIPEHIDVRDYQRIAIKAWFNNTCRGIYEMATGTGKTIAALTSAVELFNREKVLGIVILAPYIHLIDQWEEIAREFGLVPIKCYEAVSTWREKLEDHITDLNVGARKIFCAIATHDTASGPHFIAALSRVRKPLLLIADEVHHLGATSFSRGLIATAQFRLGLSATPERWMDPEGTKVLANYFDKTVFTFSLEEAIAAGYLCSYEYLPHLVQLDDDEIKQYHDISLKIAKAWVRSRNNEATDSELDSLLLERAKILNCARKKLDILKNLIPDPDQVNHALFYCAPGQINDVVNLLAKTLRMRVRRFTAEESRQERVELLNEFENTGIQALVAMKCLDEGVDVPATKTAYLLSSSGNPREFVQRRGRILRKHANKRRAIIHDLITVPPISLDRSQREITEPERELFRRELARFKEFASTAENQYQATEIILNLATTFQVLDF